MFSVDQSYRQSQRLIEASRVINQIENRLKTIDDEVNQVYAGQDVKVSRRRAVLLCGGVDEYTH